MTTNIRTFTNVASRGNRIQNTESWYQVQRLATGWAVRGLNPGMTDFPYPSKRAPEPSQLPVKWVLVLLLAGKAAEMYS